MIDLQKLNIKNKIKLFKKLYEEISGKGIQGDTELAHINSEEAQLLKLHGGAATCMAGNDIGCDANDAA